MTLKMLWRILTTPSCWIRNRSTDQRCNELIRYLIDRKDRVTVGYAYFEGANHFYRIKLSIGGNDYVFWIRNKWYDYLNESYGDFGFHGLPSRSLCFEFFDTFEKPFREKHKIGLPSKEYTFIKPEKDNAS